MELVLASSNKHKADEIRQLLPEGFFLRTLAEAGFTSQIEESADTIKGNSLLKARVVSDFLKASGLHAAVIADDSGLEVDSLGGKPGVYSARYAGEGASDESNNKKLLAEMRTVTDRKARFVTVITLIAEGKPFFFEGEISGTIAHEARGHAGFGYDPLFIPTGYRSTFAELGPEVKKQISHRAQAINKLLRFLATLQQR
jgi:XTP/dITP diphosphohydrolase